MVLLEGIHPQTSFTSRLPSHVSQAAHPSTPFILHSYRIATAHKLSCEVDPPEAILPKSTHVGVDVQLELPVDNNEVYFVALCQLSAYNISSFGRCYRRRPQSLSTMKVCTKFCSKITDMDDYLCRFNSSGILQGTTNFCKRAEQGKIRNQSPRRLAVVRC
jgi:hypothetical protein